MVYIFHFTEKNDKGSKLFQNYYEIPEVILNISILKLYYYKNALNCISTAHKSLFECLIKRNNKRRLITDYLQFRTLPSTNSSAQCQLFFFLQFFHFHISAVVIKTKFQLIEKKHYIWYTLMENSREVETLHAFLWLSFTSICIIFLLIKVGNQ